MFGRHCHENSVKNICFLSFLKSFYLFEREREREWAGEAPEGEGEAGSPLNRESNPRTLGSWPELKADTEPPRHPCFLSFEMAPNVTHTLIFFFLGETQIFLSWIFAHSHKAWKILQGSQDRTLEGALPWEESVGLAMTLVPVWASVSSFVT